MLADLKQQIANFKEPYDRLLDLQGEAMDLSAEPSRPGLLKGFCVLRQGLQGQVQGVVCALTES